MDVDDPTSSRDETDHAASPQKKRKRSFRLSTVVVSVPSFGEELRSVAVKSMETFGRASTGTPIRLLNGAAKDYATRAQFGNGAKSLGRLHFGVAGGDAVLVALGCLPLAGALALDVAAIVLEERRRAGRPLGDELSTEETPRLS